MPAPGFEPRVTLFLSTRSTSLANPPFMVSTWWSSAVNNTRSSYTPRRTELDHQQYVRPTHPERPSSHTHNQRSPIPTCIAFLPSREHSPTSYWCGVSRDMATSHSWQCPKIFERNNGYPWGSSKASPIGIVFHEEEASGRRKVRGRRESIQHQVRSKMSWSGCNNYGHPLKGIHRPHRPISVQIISWQHIHFLCYTPMT